MPSSFATETITRNRYPLIDDLGSDIVDDSAEPVPLQIEGCWLEPLQEGIGEDGQTLVVTAWKVAAPPHIDLLARDTVSYRGVEYKVVQDPQQVLSPSGVLAQTVFTIRRWVRHG